MHEVSVMQEALDLALEQAAQRKAERIHRITLRVGKMSGVFIEALQFAFEVVTQDTPAQGAPLEVVEVPVVCFCSACGREFQPEDYFFTCPTCQQVSSEVRKGRELELASMEVS